MVGLVLDSSWPERELRIPRGMAPKSPLSSKLLHSAVATPTSFISALQQLQLAQKLIALSSVVHLEVGNARTRQTSAYGEEASGLGIAKASCVCQPGSKQRENPGFLK